LRMYPKVETHNELFTIKKLHWWAFWKNS
jgi:hypothetical protein